MFAINLSKSAAARVGLRGLGVALGLAWVMALAGAARADDPLSAEFDSRYNVNGHIVNAHIVLNGDGTGSYTLDDGVTTGYLTVHYHIKSNAPINSQSPGYYTGTWSLGGESGTFRWNLYAHGAAFAGSWYNDSGRLGGPWNGQQ